MLGGQPGCTPSISLNFCQWLSVGVGTGRGPREAPVTYGSVYLCPNLEE